MGLFKKRVDPDEMQRLRSEITAMSERLERADADKTTLASHVDEMRQQLEHNDAEKAALAGHVDEMRQRLEHSDAEKAALADRVQGIVTRLDTPIDAAPDDPPALATADDVADIRTRLDELHARLDAVDQRVTSITTELANQITEISGDLDRLGERGDEPPPADEVIDELRDAQTRLASEQARYQIAFRQDLADLADRLRRS
jgi:chromosome segregation ATPase